MRRMQHALELGHVSEVDESAKQAIVLYNADDCFSTLSLRDWLEGERRQQEQAGHVQTFGDRPSASDKR